MPHHSGEKLADRFTLKESLPPDGLWSRWLAADGGTGKEVVLHFLPDAVRADAEAMARLTEAVQRNREVNHPRIRRVCEMAEGEDWAAIPMDVIEGETLAALQRKRPKRAFNPSDIAKAAGEICETVEAAHRGDLLHGDLTPENLIATADGVVVGNFGISRAVLDALRRAGELADPMRGIAWSSPAQMGGGEITRAGDIYSIGACLFDLLTGSPPFMRPLVSARRAERGIAGEPVPAEWDAAIVACLAKNPADRPASAAEVGSWLAGMSPKPRVAQVEGAVPESPASVAGEMAKGPGRGRSGALVAFVAAGTAISLALAGWYMATRMNRASVPGGSAVSVSVGAIKPPVAQKPVANSQAPTLVIRAPNPHLKVDQTLTNTLGMRFAPVGKVFFCIWLTRVHDFAEFAKATGYSATAWKNPGFFQTPDRPVVEVSWNDANQFCLWLTAKEHQAGVLAANQTYRLPTDLEWSEAVGLPPEPGHTPESRDIDVPDVYPWGIQWPPPPGAGNYTGEETESGQPIPGYNDGFAWTSPVGSFKPNKYGLYDMGGNAWEWCEDWWNAEQKQKVVRGSSWSNGVLRLSLLSSCREHADADLRIDNYGFRIVLAKEETKADQRPPGNPK